eukprot:353756-Chlamydomonas_euryale.AAC.4
MCESFRERVECGLVWMIARAMMGRGRAWDRTAPARCLCFGFPPANQLSRPPPQAACEREFQLIPPQAAAGCGRPALHFPRPASNRPDLPPPPPAFPPCLQPASSGRKCGCQYIAPQAAPGGGRPARSPGVRAVAAPLRRRPQDHSRADVRGSAQRRRDAADARPADQQRAVRRAGARHGGAAGAAAAARAALLRQVWRDRCGGPVECVRGGREGGEAC